MALPMAGERIRPYAASGAADPSETSRAGGCFHRLASGVESANGHAMSDQFQTETALVLFSGGQDSATCLAWALQRFARVEMLGFDYGQRHAIELQCRDRLLDGMKSLRTDWAAKLGDSHTLDIPTLAEISDTALTRDVAIAMGADGLPNTFVPGRNLVFLTFAAALAYRRGITPHHRRHVRDRLFRLSGLPRRDHQGAADRAQSRHGAEHSNCTRR